MRNTLLGRDGYPQPPAWQVASVQSSAAAACTFGAEHVAVQQTVALSLSELETELRVHVVAARAAAEHVVGDARASLAHERRVAAEVSEMHVALLCLLLTTDDR